MEDCRRKNRIWGNKFKRPEMNIYCDQTVSSQALIFFRNSQFFLSDFRRTDRKQRYLTENLHWFLLFIKGRGGLQFVAVGGNFCRNIFPVFRIIFN